ncbi:glycerate kinase [Caulobacter segnis]|uniref:Hydroxypyruvate reductase n=3 Tax=Caulobacter segnis TaxID=88688 RepID=D5VLP8_CAUST|nr:Hydroxypyruvate reductase [Caulobacter segnis ATCC 21756]AVQ03089.1 glycerate kinase [Caulobacter segnis]
MRSPETDLRRMFDAALAAADPMRCLSSFLPPPPKGRTVVVGAGKAAASMAAAVEAHWSTPLSGLVITRYGHGAATRHIEVVEAAHPVPDANGVEATARLLASLENLTSDDLVLCLLSGGGSALLVAPPPGVLLDDKQALIRALLLSGAPISEINCVRKHLSLVKGGRLRQAVGPARLLTLAISDVPGDDPQFIASGPTVADMTTRAQAEAILRRYDIVPTPAVASWLANPASEHSAGVAFAEGRFELVAAPGLSLEAAAKAASGLGYEPIILGDAIEGEARDVARAHAVLARCLSHGLQPGDRPLMLLSGGETTVTVVGRGRGGRNTEYLLALGLALDGEASIFALAADTDGIDGREDNAGAILRPTSLSEAAERGALGADYLADNDAYGFFDLSGDLLFTGPTLTNVNDFRAIAILPPARR